MAGPAGSITVFQPWNPEDIQQMKTKDPKQHRGPKAAEEMLHFFKTFRPPAINCNVCSKKLGLDLGKVQMTCEPKTLIGIMQPMQTTVSYAHGCYTSDNMQAEQGQNSHATSPMPDHNS